MISMLPTRRAMLRTAGISVALPFLESLCPAQSSAVSAPRPMRFAFVYAPNGKHMPAWSSVPQTMKMELPPTLQPLAKVRDYVSILSGLSHRNANAGHDGPGDHARAMATFLTGVRPKKTTGSDVRNGVSIDQVLAAFLGGTTRFPSLEVGCEGGKTAGVCDNGYSCAYQTNLSWRAESTPMPKETDPRLVFERLFGDQCKLTSDAEREKRDRDRASILDFVAEDASRLREKLGKADRRKLEEYLNGVREVERRMQNAQPKIDLGEGQMRRPLGVPENYQDHARLLIDLIVLAFQTDSTRIATVVLGNDGSNRSYREAGIAEGHHDLSHHANDPNKQRKLAAINRLHVAQLAYFLERLQAIPDGNGTLLERCSIVYGSGIRDGDRHDHDDLPILLIGGAKGRGHIRYPQGTPLCNLFLTQLGFAGIKSERFGDSTGSLALKPA